jgi:hypothetical protein
MLWKRLTHLIVGATALLIVGIVPARAETITVTFVSASVTGVFTYNVTLTGAETKPGSGDTNAVTVAASPGGDVFDSFTIFEFDGFVSVGLNTTGFTLTSTGGLDHGAESVGGLADSGAIETPVTNLVFKNIAGPTITDGGGGTLLGVIQVQSLFQSSAQTGWFTSKDSDGPGTGALSGAGYASSDLRVPVPGALAAPLPATAAVLPMLLGFVGVKRRRAL